MLIRHSYHLIRTKINEVDFNSTFYYSLNPATDQTLLKNTVTRLLVSFCVGLQLDSEYALKIRNMYEQEEASLLQCLLKCITLASLQAIHKKGACIFFFMKKIL